MNDAELVAFLQWALPRLGLRWPGFRKVRGQVRKRISRRIQELGFEELEDYRTRLDADPHEWVVLDSLCRISISRFYRDRAIFEHLRRVLLPELAALALARSEHTLRVLSAGCASGEEPYTIAMIGSFELLPSFPELALDILAIDADEHMLERARLACYEPSSLRELPVEWRNKAFEPQNGLFRLREEIRRLVDFQSADIRTSLPSGPFHLALCRNLAFTYFSEAQQRAFAAQLAERLIPGGALVLGCHEALPPNTPGWSPGPPGTHSFRNTGIG